MRTLLISSTSYRTYRVIFTSREFLKEHPDVVQKFVTASVQGWADSLKDPGAVDAELARLNPALSAEQTRFSVETLKAGHFIDGAGTPESHLGHFTAERWATTYRQLVDLKVITKSFDPSSA